MKVSIMTCEDRTQYLGSTIDQLDQQGIKYDIYYQGKAHKKGTIKVTKPYDSVQLNAQYNYAMILINSRNDIIIEDDVQICNNFKVRCMDYLEPYQAQNSRYAIAMYSCYNWNNSLTLLTEYPLMDFYGTQAMMYDQETRIGFGQYLLEHLGEQPYDLALKIYLEKTNTPLLATKHSLVQHMGVKTTGLGHHHQAFNFIDNLT